MDETPSGDALVARIRELRASGATPKTIARTLGVPSARVAPVLRALAAEAESATDDADRPLVGCWINPGWNTELQVIGRPEWPTGTPADPGTAGLIRLVIARQAPRARVRVFEYLVDAFCLGVKDVRAPKVMDQHLLDGYLSDAYASYGCLPIVAPLDLACDLVFGSIEYARGLGLDPSPAFTASAAAHLGRWMPPSAVTFGREGKPFYIQGPRDDTNHIMRTLRRTVGDRNFHYLIQTGGGFPTPR